MNLSPAEAALQKALQETTITLSPSEEPRLLKLIARNLQPETNQITPAVFTKLLCIIRRKEWAKKLNKLVQQENKTWIQSEDIAWAVSFVHDPEPNIETLQSALQQALYTRLRQSGKNANEAFQTLYTDLADSGKPIIGSKALRLMAQDVAVAFGLENDDAEHFIEEIIYHEQKQQQKDQEIHQIARDRKKDEIKKQREWEDSLVSFKEIPPLLHCSHKEVLRWIAENKIPVSQKIKKHGKEIWRFDPKEIKALRPQISNWRNNAPTKSKKNAFINLGDLNIKNKVIANVAAMDRYAAHGNP